MLRAHHFNCAALQVHVHVLKSSYVLFLLIFLHADAAFEIISMHDLNDSYAIPHTSPGIATFMFLTLLAVWALPRYSLTCV